MKVGDRVRSPKGLTGTITRFRPDGFVEIRIDLGQSTSGTTDYPRHWLTIINEENPHERKPSRGT